MFDVFIVVAAAAAVVKVQLDGLKEAWALVKPLWNTSRVVWSPEELAAFNVTASPPASSNSSALISQSAGGLFGELFGDYSEVIRRLSDFATPKATI